MVSRPGLPSKADDPSAPPPPRRLAAPPGHHPHPATPPLPPGVRIILGEPFLLPVGKRLPTYAADMLELRKRQAAVRRLAAKYHLPLIPYRRALDRACRLASAGHWSWNGIYPTYAGHARMAREWLRTAQAFWPHGQAR